MNIDYLKERFERAKALCSDIVKIDIEEFASLLEWIDETNDIITKLNKLMSELEKEKQNNG